MAEEGSQGASDSVTPQYMEHGQVTQLYIYFVAQVGLELLSS